MDNPIKIIFKYKNNNRKSQYGLYIFVGDIPNKVFSVLKKIADTDLYKSLIIITKEEYKILEDFYGNYWFNKFFVSEHIKSIIKYINKDNIRKKKLIKKYGEKWFSKHFMNNELFEKNITYSYNEYIQDSLKDKIKKTLNEIDDEDLNNYEMKNKLKGGLINNYSNESIDENEEIESEEYKDENEEIESEEYKDENEETESEEYKDENEETESEEYKDENEETESEEYKDVNKQKEDDLNFEEEINEIESLYKNVLIDVDKDNKKTLNLIENALKKNKKSFNRNKLIKFDKSKDNMMYDDKLENLFIKNYCLEYINKDDNILKIKYRITNTILNNDKFHGKCYISPDRQYLWSEYYNKGKKEKVMVGQKWLNKNELLKIDIEPSNNIRIYEELRGILKVLRNNLKRYGTKIRREDDSYKILYDYDDYYTNNELFMVDIYNEFGLNYNPTSDVLKNIFDVYCKIYFNSLTSDDTNFIIDFLNKKNDIEYSKSENIYKTIKNDLIMENEVIKIVKDSKKNSNYKNIFNTNHVTQSNITVHIKTVSGNKLDLYRIFNNFKTDSKYPFLHYQTIDGKLNLKFDKNTVSEYKKDKKYLDILNKWFEYAPYGISFKINVSKNNNYKFMSITINENGRLEYKNQWKEEDKATIKDTIDTYKIIKELIRKINKNNDKFQLIIPSDSHFKYAFINTIQKFVLPEKFIINHNDLSEFARYFFPYVTLVIEPRKRVSKDISKINKKGKYGTYLKYKRVTNYDSKIKIEHRILYFMRNYDYTYTSLSKEISKQFNITEDKALFHIKIVKDKYPIIKKSRKILKKLDSVPKYKPPGINIDIQGKSRDKYKIKISGARDNKQLNRITSFMNILIYLYIETYLYKYPKRNELKEKLKKLTNIAKRRHIVEVQVYEDKEIKNVKKMAVLDKERLGFRPDKGQSQWSRACQNSGTDKKRQPRQSTNLGQLLKKGYKFNNETKMYEKKVKIKGKKGHTVIRAVKLKASENDVYYTCSPGKGPKSNGEHIHVGFLTRSKNPYGHCMPCCFKKDQFVSDNLKKRDYFLECIGREVKEREDSNEIGETLYILQDTNKVQEGRFAMLPKYLDHYFNFLLGKKKKISQHYLVSSKDGYFFKVGSEYLNYPFLSTIGLIFDLSVDQIKEKVYKLLNNDKSNILFKSLNKGEIITAFKTKETYIDFIKKNAYINFNSINHILSLPNCLTKNGLNIIIFEKKVIKIKTDLERDKITYDYVIKCHPSVRKEELKDTNRDTIFLLKDGKIYFPIVNVIKEDENSKEKKIEKIFHYNNTEDNIVNHISDFYKRNCLDEFTRKISNKNKLNSKDIYNILIKLNSEFHPKYQILDMNYRCKYIVTNNQVLVPCNYSGSLYNLKILSDFKNVLLKYSVMKKKLEKLNKITEHKLDVTPIGYYYKKKKKNNILITSIITNNYNSIPVKEELVNINKLNKNMVLYNRPLNDEIDQLLKNKEHKKLVDKRIISINNQNYYNEGYNLFKLNFSEYINKDKNLKIREKIIKIIKSKDKKNIKNNLKLLLYGLIDKDLLKIYKSIKTGGSSDRLVSLVNNYPDINNYEIDNERLPCDKIKKDKCSSNIHCKWSHNKCIFTTTKEIIIKYINKIVEELYIGDVGMMEILKIDDYYVSDIVSFDKFTKEENETIVRSNNINIKKILKEIFGKGNIPIIGKRKGITIGINYNELNSQNPLKNYGSWYIQNIINNNNTLFRAYSNSVYWIIYNTSNIKNRNLGYINPIQTELSNYFKSIVIDWLLSDKNTEYIKKHLTKYMIFTNDPKNYIIKFLDDNSIMSESLVELIILSILIKKYYIVIYNEENKIMYIFNNGLIYDHNKNNKIPKINNKNSINLIFNYNNYFIPEEISIIYYK
jgi:hypothetical protein